MGLTGAGGTGWSKDAHDMFQTTGHDIYTAMLHETGTHHDRSGLQYLLQLWLCLHGTHVEQYGMNGPTHLDSSRRLAVQVSSVCQAADSMHIYGLTTQSDLHSVTPTVTHANFTQLSCQLHQCHKLVCSSARYHHVHHSSAFGGGGGEGAAAGM